MGASVAPFAVEDDELKEELDAITTVGGGGLSVSAAPLDEEALAAEELVREELDLEASARRRAASLARFNASATREGVLLAWLAAEEFIREGDEVVSSAPFAGCCWCCRHCCGTHSFAVTCHGSYIFVLSRERNAAEGAMAPSPCEAVALLVFDSHVESAFIFTLSLKVVCVRVRVLS